MPSNGNGHDSGEADRRYGLDQPMSAGETVQAIQAALETVRGCLAESARAQGTALSEASHHLLDLAASQGAAILDLRQRVAALETLVAERDAAHSPQPSASPATEAEP